MSQYDTIPTRFQWRFGFVLVLHCVWWKWSWWWRLMICLRINTCVNASMGKLIHMIVHTTTIKTIEITYERRLPTNDAHYTLSSFILSFSLWNCRWVFVYTLYIHVFQYTAYIHMHYTKKKKFGHDSACATHIHIKCQTK